MFRKNTQLSPIEIRKQLLIVESEINRAHMVDDLAALRTGVRAFTDRAKSYGSIAASAASLVAGFTALRRHKSSEAEAKPSWLQTAIKGAGMVSTLWSAFRSRGPEQPPE